MATYKRKHITMPKTALTTLSVATLLIPLCAAAKPQFNVQFVHGTENVDAVNTLAVNNGLSEGIYTYDIYLDLQFIESLDVEFKKIDDHIVPCLKYEDFKRYGIELPPQEPQQCYPLMQKINNSRITVDPNYHRIDVSVPQADLVLKAQGAIPSSAYDEGINAAFVGYGLNTTRYTENHHNHDDIFTSLNSGVNLFDWHLRNQSTLNYSTDAGYRATSISSWAERNIIPWRSRLRLGQSSTNDTVFDSVQFIGAQLSSDESMLPESMQGFAPVVRGVANSNATVEIRQDGYLIYRKSVAPGPFEIQDLYASNQSGDLDVTVTEANGQKNQFKVPYSAVPNMLREGNVSFQATTGKYRDGYSHYQPKFIQGSAGYGLLSGTTLYGGMLTADHYQSAALGIGQDLYLLGAISFDATFAKTQLASGENAVGQSFRFLYSKSLNDYGTDFRVVGYRYSTAGFYSFSEAVNERQTWSGNLYDTVYNDPNQEIEYVGEERNQLHYYSSHYNNRRQRLDLSLTQHLWSSSSCYVSLSEQTYWGSSNQERTVQVGYNSNVGPVNFSIYAQDTSSLYASNNQTINLSLYVPLSLSGNNGSLSFSAQHDRKNGDNYSSGYSATALEDKLSYGLQAANSSDNQQSIAGNAAFQGSKGNLRGGYAIGRDYQNINMGVDGGLLLHSGGITLMQPPGDTMILVEAKNAAGVHVEQQNGVAIDNSGYAVITDASAWHYNHISLHAADISAGMDIPDAAKNIVPAEKSISKLVFNTFTGHNYLVHTQLSTNTLPPVGASVRDVKGRNHGVVGMNGDLYVSGVEDKALLEVRWGARSTEHCFIHMPDNHGKPATRNGYDRLTALCKSS